MDSGDDNVGGRAIPVSGDRGSFVSQSRKRVLRQLPEGSYLQSELVARLPGAPGGRWNAFHEHDTVDRCCPPHLLLLVAVRDEGGPVPVEEVGVSGRQDTGAGDDRRGLEAPRSLRRRARSWPGPADCITSVGSGCRT